jgi:hypothetical protein
MAMSLNFIRPRDAFFLTVVFVMLIGLFKAGISLMLVSGFSSSALIKVCLLPASELL